VADTLATALSGIPEGFNNCLIPRFEAHAGMIGPSLLLESYNKPIHVTTIESASTFFSVRMLLYEGL
jgi:hypothetical protein